MIDLTGERFGTLVAECYAGHDEKRRQAQWIFVCDCGHRFRGRGSDARKGKGKLRCVRCDPKINKDG